MHRGVNLVHPSLGEPALALGQGESITLPRSSVLGELMG